MCDYNSNEVTKRCKYCGKLFKTKKRESVYCSATCRNDYKLKKKPLYVEPNKSLSKKVKEADKMGLNYGQMQALKYLAKIDKISVEK